MPSIDRRIVGTQPRSGPAFGSVDPVGAPRGVVDQVQIKVWKHGSEFGHSPLNLTVGIAVDSGFGQITTELPDHSSGSISPAGHRHSSAIAVDAMAMKHR